MHNFVSVSVLWLFYGMERRAAWQEFKDIIGEHAAPLAKKMTAL
jgi:hypothetical protein